MTTGSGSGSGSGSASETGLATVVVLGDYLNDPVANLPVVFADKDGAILGVEMTDPSGKAAHLIGHDASATVIHSPDIRLQTRLGLQPGETIRFGTMWKPLANVAHMTFSFPAAGPYGYDYMIATPCGSTGLVSTLSVSLDLDSRCTVGGNVAVTVMSVSTTSYNIRGTITKSVPVVNNTGASFTGPYAAPVMIEGTFTMPDNMYLDGFMTENYDEREYTAANDAMSSYSMNGSGGYLHYFLPAAPGSELHNEYTVHGPVSHQIIGKRTAYSTANFNADLSALTGWLTDEHFDATSRTATWTTDGLGAAPDAVKMRLSWLANGKPYDWVVIAPGTATSMTLPVLPTDYDAFNVHATDTVGGTLFLAYLGKPWSQIGAEAGVWFGRENIDTIDWLDGPDFTEWRLAASQF